ncbi:hypothetical protein F0P96_05030 [Hymenobacter busanensis]|uniref:Uncharacterized protein n=1 Tax=Hymenobacter busanensis TaxID=2607656 RepID=A0A7L5A0Q8_9BACT|nr:YdeI/OmpD-associated family protein [Hymenobacter busanensis]KAA9338212.1 hypothetical protein F0P96_05030 [Hymenobacter busanensis]QHJ09364.1 hypothetical protein GUY19_19580 [Hymenobacter busanensis]
MNPKTDFYFRKNEQWQAELAQLRRIVLDCGLEEELKWGVPCYSFRQRNVLLLHVFKNYCALLFMKGALLQDADGLLVQQTRNVQATRQVRFTAAADIVALEPTLKATIYEAIAVEEAGLQVPYKPTAEFAMPAELQQQLTANPALQAAFDALTPGRQRGYLLHIGEAKQAKTRAARVEKCTPLILAGKGLQDDYFTSRRR